MTRPNGVTNTYTYDVRGQLTGLLHYDTIPQTPLASYGYTYNASGSRLTSTETAAGSTTNLSYTYDDADRLLRERRAVNGVASETTWRYDDNGNRTSQTRGTQTTTYAYNTLDQLMWETSAAGGLCLTGHVSNV